MISILGLYRSFSHLEWQQYTKAMPSAVGNSVQTDVIVEPNLCHVFCQLQKIALFNKKNNTGA